MQGALVAFEREHVIGLGRADLAGDLGLAAHRVNGDDAARQFERAQQFGNGRNLVALLLDFDLAKHQPVFACPGADHVDGFLAFGPVMAAAQRLAVDGDDLRANGLAQALGPLAKAGGKLLGVKERKHPAEGIMAGDAMRQLQKTAQEILLGVTELFKVHKVFGPAKHGTDRDHQNVAERVHLAAIDPRIFNDREVENQTVGMGLFRHPKCLSGCFPKVQI